MTPPLPRILDERELAAHLRLSIRGLQSLRQRGLGPAYAKVDRSVRYDWRDVEAWLAERKVRGVKSPRFERAAANAGTR